MDIIEIVGLSLVATIIIIILKINRPEIALIISVMTGILIFFLIVSEISYSIELILTYAKKVNVDMTYLNLLLKIIGIAYISEFGAEICKDAGEGAIASKIELAGKVAIIVLAVPIVTSLLDFIIKIIP